MFMSPREESMRLEGSGVASFTAASETTLRALFDRMIGFGGYLGAARY